MFDMPLCSWEGLTCLEMKMGPVFGRAASRLRMSAKESLDALAYTHKDCLHCQGEGCMSSRLQRHDCARILGVSTMLTNAAIQTNFFGNRLCNHMGCMQLLKQEQAVGLQAYWASDVHQQLSLQQSAPEGACQHASGGRLIIHSVLTSSTSM